MKLVCQGTKVALMSGNFEICDAVFLFVSFLSKAGHVDCYNVRALL